MYCPRCGQERTSHATNFCSRCGYLLTYTSELLLTGGTPVAGLLPAKGQTDGRSPRGRGVRHGIFLLLMALVLFPAIGILFAFTFRGMPPWPAGLVLFLVGGAGLLRIAYALMFEGGATPPPLPPHLSRSGPGSLGMPDNPQLTAGANAEFAAGQTQFTPATVHWRDTNDLEPHSVTDSTTKLLEKEPDHIP